MTTKAHSKAKTRHETLPDYDQATATLKHGINVILNGSDLTEYINSKEFKELKRIAKKVQAKKMSGMSLVVYADRDRFLAKLASELESADCSDPECWGKIAPLQTFYETFLKTLSPEGIRGLYLQSAASPSSSFRSITLELIATNETTPHDLVSPVIKEMRRR